MRLALRSIEGRKQMKMRASWISVVLLILVSIPAASESRHMMDDPLFGIRYDPQKVHFERVPSSLLKRCPGLTGQYVVAWVYGHLKTTDSEYYLISGFRQYRDQVTGVPAGIAPDETDGLAVALRGSRCRVDLADDFLDQKVSRAKDATPIMAPKSAVAEILQDAFEKYAEAFRGKQKFLSQVDLNVIGPRIVVEQLKVYEKEASVP